MLSLLVEETTPQRAVELGVAFLDEHHPGWAELIDAPTLDLWCAESCVFGQLYGTYDKGLARYGLSEEDGCRLGLNVGLVDERQRMTDLQMEWERVVDERTPAVVFA